METLLAEQGVECEALPGSLRYIARQMLIRAGQDTSAAREVGDRLDGKPAQAIVGDDEHDPVNVLQRIEYVVIDPANPGSEEVPPTS